MCFSGNLKHIEESSENPEIPIIISEINEVNSISTNNSTLSEKKVENNIESISAKSKAKSELKLDKKPHKKHSDKASNLEKSETEKTKETKDKDKKPTKQLKQSTASDKHREPSEQYKHKSKEGGHKTKKEKLIKKHSKENILDEKIVNTPGTSSEKLPKQVKQVIDRPLPRKPFVKAKPPNVLVYADSSETRGNVKSVLHEVLNRNRYTIYELPAIGAPHFSDNSTLVVVCGNVNPNLTSSLLNYFLTGGNLLCLCSDFLNSVLHTFTTAEVNFYYLLF